MYRVFRITVPHLCGYCGGAVDLFILISTQLHRSGFDIEFETLFESIWHMVADLRQRKGRISGSIKNGTSVVCQQCQNKVKIQRKDSGVISKVSPNF